LGLAGCASLFWVKVRLRNPDREVSVGGPRRVRDVLAELGIDPDTVLVIRDKALVTRRNGWTTVMRSRSAR